VAPRRSPLAEETRFGVGPSRAWAAPVRLRSNPPESFRGGANGGSEERFLRDMSSSKAGEGLEKEGWAGGSREGRAEKSTRRFENDEVEEGTLAGGTLPVLNPALRLDANCCKEEEREGFVDSTPDMRKLSSFRPSVVPRP
jgi:hypothetical protein